MRDDDRPAVLTYAVSFTPRAQRQLLTLRPSIGRRVAARVDALSLDPRPPGCRRLVGADRWWRVRVSDFRTIYEIGDGRLLVLVIDIGHRREVYRL